MTKESSLINNKIVNYLIHGQPLSYKYRIPGALFVVIKYENEIIHNWERFKWFKKKYYFKKNNGVFNNFTNAYSPKITFYCFGFGIWKFTKNLKVNFVNVKLPDIEIREVPLKLNTIFTIKKPLLRFEINKRIFSKTFLKKNNFSILNKEWKVRTFNDYEEYKQNYKTN